jgi:hypothetical protein
MRALPFAMASLLVTSLALAQERAADSAPPETVSVIYVVLFGLIFVGMIAGFFVYLWWGERNQKAAK